MKRMIREPMTTTKLAPRYELRVRRRQGGRAEMEVFQMPGPATPGLKEPLRVAGIAGAALDLVESRVLRKLEAARIRLASARDANTRAYPVDEELALVLGLLFRALAPMRNRARMREVAAGVESMGKEEAAYWLGMAMHRRKPRRVLAALRMLLTDPDR